LFVENKLAKIYKTVRVKGSLEQALKQLDKAIAGLPRDSQILIEAEPLHPIFEGFETLRIKYHEYVFTQKKLVEDEVIERVANSEDRYIPIILNRETLTEAIYAEVTEHQNLDSEQKTQLRQLLNDLHF
jgi:hypothetical protein